jgi:hypothetical protein
MNYLYILIPIVILTFVSLILWNPKLRVLNKKHTRYLKQSKPGIKWSIPVFDKKTNQFVAHPPILKDIQSKKKTENKNSK